jgi:hypothetical protein
VLLTDGTWRTDPASCGNVKLVILVSRAEVELPS